MNTEDKNGNPLSPFRWREHKGPSIFGQDRYFTGRYKKLENPVSITIKKLNSNQPLSAYSKAHNGNS